LTNVSGEKIVWTAKFYSESEKLLADGKAVETVRAKDKSDRNIIMTKVPVNPGQTISIKQTIRD
jgi:hypothetical protein